MSKKMTVLLTFAFVLSLPVMAQNNREAESLKNSLKRIVVVEVTPLQQYKEQVAKVTQPTYQNLLPSLQVLTDYNQLFLSEKDTQAKRQLANQLLAQTKTGWNNYRAIGLSEIFERYVPFKGQNDKAVGDLEYFVKLYSVSKEQQKNMLLLKNMPQITAALMKQYQDFALWAEKTPSYDEKEIISHLVPVIKEYNALRVLHPEVAELLHTSLFEQPFKGGWNRTHTISDIRRNLGTDTDVEDSYRYYSAKYLQEHYGVSLKDAEIFAQFTKHYYRWNLNDQQKNMHLLENMSPLTDNFIKAYNEFSSWVEDEPNRTGKATISHMIPVIKEYNAFKGTHPELVKMIKEATFKLPLYTYWGGLYTFESFSRDLGVDEESGGLYEYYSGKRLQQLYGVTAEEGEIFSQFVTNYYK